MHQLKCFSAIAILLLISSGLFSQQLKLGKLPYLVQKSSVLELESDNQGLLYPRIADTLLINVLSPPDGTVIYFNPLKKLMLRTNGVWQPLTLGSDLPSYWSTNGNANGVIRSIGNIDNVALQLITNNLERMSILANGNIGIGSTAPTQKLELTGNFRLTGAFMPGNQAGSAGSILTSAGANNSPVWMDPNTYLDGISWQLGGNNPTSNKSFGTISNYAVQFITNNTEKMRLTTAGYLGIATNAPGNFLEVGGTINSVSGLRLTGLGAATPAASNSKLLSVNASGDIIVTTIPAAIGWSTTGNTGTIAGTNFLGTIDDKPLLFKANNEEFIELGRRQTLGLTQSFPDYSDPGEHVMHLKTPLQFFAPAAQFYKPKIFVDSDGNFRVKGSSAGTDYFEFGATGTNNNGGFEFIIGDDGDEPIVFKSYHYQNGMSEIMRLQSGRMAVGSNSFNGTNPEKLLIDAGITNSYNLMTGKGNIDNYLQLNIQNNSGGGSASSDLVATANNGTETTNYVNLGINSGGFSSAALPVIGGANNAYLYSTGNDFVVGNGSAGHNLRLFTGGYDNSNERLRIDGNGNVGIGNLAPSQRLDITGNIRFSGALMPNNQAGTAGMVLTSAGAGAPPVWAAGTSSGWAPGGNSFASLSNFGTTNNFDIPFITNNTEAMRLTTTSRLGIGFTAPTETLDVNGNIRIGGGNKRLVFAGMPGDPDAVIQHRSYGVNEQAELLFFVGNDNSPSFGPDRIRMVAEEFRLQTFNNAGNSSLVNAEAGTLSLTRFLIDAAGNVGINNSTPLERMDITGNLRLSGALMPSGAAGTSGQLLRSNGAGNAPTWIDASSIMGATSWALGGNSNASVSNFGTTNAQDLPIITGNVERMRIATAGNVGIGTNNPQFRLHVNGETALQSNLFVDNSSSNTGTLASGSLRFGNNSGEGIGSKRDAGGNQYGLDFYTGYWAWMSITNTGIISVGNTFQPVSNGLINLGASNARWSNVWAANGTIQTSDRRQKSNIRDLNLGLSEIMKLNPVRYTWKNDTTATQKLGLIAQDVRTVIPEVVIGDESKEILGMNYAELVPVLINAIKEQQSQIDELKKQVNELKKKN